MKSEKGVCRLNFRCLVLDHDDTVVRSAQTVNYPALLDALKILRPNMTISFADFHIGCFRQNFAALCRDVFQFTPEENALQFELWKDYVREHTPPLYEGMETILRRFHAEGGIIAVASHSGVENITRDYMTHLGFAPDAVFGWELGEELRKPAPYALTETMRRFDLRPDEMLMVDDLKGGMEMAQSCGVPFACAGWSHDIPEIAEFMRDACPLYLETTQALGELVFGKKGT